MRNIIHIIIIVVSLAVPLTATADGDQEKISHVIKGFIYNFLKFVEWPDAYSFRHDGKANICILDDHPFAEHFVSHPDLKPQGIIIHVSELTSHDTIQSCHILFIGKTVEDHTADILTQAQHYPVLTISEISTFADHGGIIEIATVGKQVGLFTHDKISLRINLKNAIANGLSIDARLLQVATEIIK